METVETVKDVVQGIGTQRQGIDRRDDVYGQGDHRRDGRQRQGDVPTSANRRKHPSLGDDGRAVCAGFLGGKVVQRLSQGAPSLQDLSSSTTTPLHLRGGGLGRELLSPSISSVRSVGPRKPRGRTPRHGADHCSPRSSPKWRNSKGWLSARKRQRPLWASPGSTCRRRLESQLEEMVDNVTRKMGGKPIQGLLVEEFPNTPAADR